MPDAMRPSYGEQENDHGRLVAFPAGGRPASPPSNLPLQLSSFVGRKKELAELGRLLESTRLLTLTGPGGCGKTRLAVVAASELLWGFHDGVRLVELASLSDPSYVSQAVASVLGISEQPGRMLVETLSTHLRTRELLLLLDNCEHLIGACAELVEALLRSCPRLRVLATSREALAVAGEVAWPVPPLSLPDLRRLSDTDSLLQNESARLFVDRTTAVKPTFTLSEQNAPAVAQICYHLDGIPLALELAAARAKVLSVDQIAGRLDDTFGLLFDGSRNAKPRHKTLEATMDWSHELLPEEERVLFRRLSVFSGGFTFGATEAVCAGHGIEKYEVLKLLSPLVDKSLVTVREESNEARYHLLETVRQYGREKLYESGDEDTVRGRHVDFCVGFAEEAERELSGPHQVRWLRRLQTEHDNLRTALSWSLGEGERADSGLRLAAALWPFWFTRGYMSEGRRWIESAITHTDPSLALFRAKALHGAGVIATFQDDCGRAKALVEDALALFRALEDKDGIAFSLVSLCTVAMSCQRTDIPVGTLLEELKCLSTEIENRRTVGHMLNLEGGIALAQGEQERALKLWEESLELSRGLQDVFGITTCLTNIGLLTLGRSDDEAAATRLRESLRLARELDHKMIIQYCLTGLGGVAASRRDLISAARLWGAAESMSEAYGTRFTRASHALIDYEGRLAAARSQLEDTAWTAAWAEGRTISPEQAVEHALEQDDLPEPDDLEPYPAGLSAREVEVLRLVATGLTNAEVAEQLFLSTRTVDWHLGSIYRKLGLHSRTEATRFAADNGLL